MSDEKLHAALLVLVVFVGFFSLSYALSSPTVVITSNGRISPNVMARSGSAKDIQAAVNQIASSGGVGNVSIPAGTFNFVEVGEPWTTVNIPAGIDIFGAKTERDANGQVVEWKTILKMPYEVPTTGPDDTPTWFETELDESNLAKTFRISDIKMVGYRYYDHSSITQYCGVHIYDCSETSYATSGMTNARVDHCCFQDMCGFGVYFQPASGDPNRRVVSGVIDHNVFNNTIGEGIGSPDEWADRTLTYGIALSRGLCDVWDSDLNDIIGHYTNYTVFIENNYFSKWRHCVSSIGGIVYVFRYNTINADYGTGSVDLHGSYADDTHPNYVGTRCVEIYNNTFENPAPSGEPHPWVVNFRGGAGLIYNNTMIGYDQLVRLSNDGGNYAPYCPQCHVNQVYIWSNTVGTGVVVGSTSDCILNVNYFLRAPTLAQDGLTYTPYPFPHPLTS